MKKLNFFIFVFFLFKVFSYAEVLDWIQLKKFLKENNPEIVNEKILDEIGIVFEKGDLSELISNAPRYKTNDGLYHS